MHPIVILGAGGFAREVAWLIQELNEVKPTWEILGFAVADKSLIGTFVGNYIIRYLDDEVPDLEVAVAMGLGSPELLSKVRARFRGIPPSRFPNLIHPSVRYDRERVQLGIGNIICAGTVLTTDITIGSFNVFNLNCTIGHDCIIGDYCVVNPGCNISGSTSIGSGCLLGTGSTVLQGLKVGVKATIGAGAVVTKDVLAGTTVVGVPARPLKRGGR